MFVTVGILGNQHCIGGLGTFGCCQHVRAIGTSGKPLACLGSLVHPGGISDMRELLICLTPIYITEAVYMSKMPLEYPECHSIWNILGAFAVLCIWPLQAHRGMPEVGHPFCH